MKRGSWVAVFCSAGAIAAACGSQPSVTNGGHDVSAAGTSSAGTGGDGSAATSSGGSAATGNLAINEAGDSSGDSVVATALAFDPPSVTLTLGATGAPKTATYTLKATVQGGGTRVVAAESLQVDRPDIASFALGPPAVLTVPATVPVDVYCQNVHVLQRSLMFGHDALVYCACQSGLPVKSLLATYGSQ